MSASLLTRPNTVTLTYAPLGAARELFVHRDPELLISGPSGTGKSRACLEKLHLAACRHPGMRGLLVRKTRAALTESAMITFEHKVLHPLDGVAFRPSSQEYRYPNGSTVVVGGLDKAIKIMSSEYDLVYCQESVELTEHDWESLTTRLRNGVMPYQQLLADCNPDSPSHWLKRRVDAGKTMLLESRHEDNPVLWDSGRRTWTEFGAVYIAKLDALTGVRLLRLRKGLWAAAEGMVYDGWDPLLHLVDRRTLPKEWPRYLAVDFGYTNPFCAQWWAVDPDGRAYREREVYHTQRLVEDHAHQIRALCEGQPAPRAIICDHDAEDRATLERHLVCSCAGVAAPPLPLSTLPAHKAISPGIQAVASRLKPAGDGKPRLVLLRDSLVERDPALVDAKKPTCTEEEVESYVWDISSGRKKGEVPVDRDNHGCLVAGTLVETADGPIAIERVRAGMHIWTRSGLRPVLAAGMTSLSKPVVTLRLSNGCTIIGTGDHLVWVHANGWVRMDALRYNDIVWTRVGAQLPTTRGEQCVSVATTRTMRTTLAMVGEASQFVNDGTCLSCSLRIWESGLRARQLTALTTMAHTNLRTVAGPQPRNKRTIDQALTGMPTLHRFSHSQPSGIVPMRGGLGIVSTASEWRHSERHKHIDARSAALNIRPVSSVRTLVSAPTTAGRHGGAEPALTMSSVSVLPVPAPSASIATSLRNAALVRVLSVFAESKQQPVYNLTVAGPPEFFANGTLVHNCDAMRYMIAHLDLRQELHFA